MSNDIFHTTNNIFNQVDPYAEAEAEELFTLNGLEDFVLNGCYMLKNKDSENVFAKKILRKNGSNK